MVIFFPYYASIEKSFRGIYRNLLAGFRRMWKRSPRRRFSGPRDRIRRSLAGLRTHRPDHGVRDRPRFRMSSESRSVGGIGRRQAISAVGTPRLRGRASAGRHRRIGRALRRRVFRDSACFISDGWSGSDESDEAPRRSRLEVHQSSYWNHRDCAPSRFESWRERQHSLLAPGVSPERGQNSLGRHLESASGFTRNMITHSKRKPASRWLLDRGRGS